MGRGGPRQGGRQKLSPQQRRQIKQLVEQSHIPYPAAVRVATGQSSLNDVLQEMLREEKIKNLMAAHDFNRALATSIALGRADLDTILLRRRKNETLETNYARSCLETSQAEGVPLGLALHGHKRLRGRVLSVEKYTFQFLEDGSADPTEIHKTLVKYGYDPADFKQVRKAHSVDNQTKKQALEPIVRVKDRHHFKNLTLQKAMDAGSSVEVTTLEGDVFRGQVLWFGRWEFGLRVTSGTDITLFRHAVFRLTPWNKGGDAGKAQAGKAPAQVAKGGGGKGKGGGKGRR